VVPGAPVLVGEMVTPLSSMRASTSYLYVAAWNSGLSILPLQCDEPAGLPPDARATMPAMRLSPNPKREMTRISYSRLPHTCWQTLFASASHVLANLPWIVQHLLYKIVDLRPHIC